MTTLSIVSMVLASRCTTYTHVIVLVVITFVLEVFLFHFFRSPALVPRKMDLTNLSSDQKSKLMDSVQEQFAIATVTELLTKVTNKCFQKCITKPGTSLDSSETKCLNHCVDRFFDSYNIVTMSYSMRVQRENGP